MIIRCENCGGTVTTEQLSGVVNCEYCGAAIRIDEPQPPAPAPQPPSAPVPTAMQGTPSEPRQRSRLGLVVLLVLVVAVGGGVAYFVASGGALSTFGEWYSPSACLVDANGDHALDLVGWAGSPSDQRNLSLIDGATGQRLWSRSAGYAIEADVLCTSRDGFAVARPNFDLELFSLSALDQPRRVALSDKVADYTPAAGCVAIKTRDGATTGVDLASGARVPCAVATPVDSNRRSIWETSEEPRVEQLGDVRYVVEERTQGTPVLTVRAKRSGVPLWSVPLRYAAASDDLVLAATPEMVVTYGVETSNTDVGVLIGLDPATGAVRYERSQGSVWSGRNFTGSLFNGRYLVIIWGFGLHAYEPATGERVWHIGGR